MLREVATIYLVPGEQLGQLSCVVGPSCEDLGSIDDPVGLDFIQSVRLRVVYAEVGPPEAEDSEARNADSVEAGEVAAIAAIHPWRK